MVRDLLGPQGHVVAHAKDAKDAFGVLHAGLPDVVLVDGALADIGGIELVRALRRSPQGERLTVILLAPNPERMREDLQDEAVRVIAPPIQGEWLVTLMEQLRAERNSSIWPASNADTF
ncbi:MAG: response regulator [Pseudomonadota bacterium]|nr:response regulator [Pseudomonadota bacterium]